MYNFTKRILYWRELVDAAIRFQNHYTTILHWRETHFALKVHPCMPSPSSSYQPPWPPVLGWTVHSTNIYNRAPFRSKNELTTLKMCIPPSSAQSSPACWATRSSRTSLKIEIFYRNNFSTSSTSLYVAIRKTLQQTFNRLTWVRDRQIAVRTASLSSSSWTHSTISSSRWNREVKGRLKREVINASPVKAWATSSAEQIVFKNCLVEAWPRRRRTEPTFSGSHLVGCLNKVESKSVKERIWGSRWRWWSWETRRP